MYIKSRKIIAQNIREQRKFKRELKNTREWMICSEEVGKLWGVSIFVSKNSNKDQLIAVKLADSEYIAFGDSAVTVVKHTSKDED